MDEVFKEIRKRKALAEKLAAEENNAYLQIYPHKCFYGAFCFVLGDASHHFSKIRHLRFF